MPRGVSPAGDFISAEELIEWLMLGRTRTWELLASGEIPSYKIGRLRRIRKIDVEQYLAGRRYDPKDLAVTSPLDVEGRDRRSGGLAERRVPTPFHFQYIANRGACIKPRVVPHNAGRSQNLRKWR